MTDLSLPPSAVSPPPDHSSSGGRRARSRLGWVAGAILLLLGSMAIAPGIWVAPSPAPADPHQCSIRTPDGGFQDRLPPSSEHWFGTDLQGCDYYTQVIYGARASVTTGLLAVLIGGTIAVVFGGLAGFAGGWVDSVISRCTDVFLGIPGLVLAILLMASLAGDDRSISDVALVLGLLGWPFALRLVRSTVLEIRSLHYIDASRLLGVSPVRTVVRHVLPNALAPLVGYIALSVGGAVIAETGLTFLGIGLQAPTISWGQMIARGQERIADVPHLLLFPSVMLTLTVIAFFGVGELLERRLNAGSRP